jgi:hypothetical protein
MVLSLHRRTGGAFADLADRADRADFADFANEIRVNTWIGTNIEGKLNTGVTWTSSKPREYLWPGGGGA